MSDRRLEENFHVCEDGLDLDLSNQYQIRLAPMLAEREYNYNSVHFNTLPSFSSYMLDAYLQESKAPTHTYDSPPEEYSFHQPSHDIRRVHAQQALNFVNAALTHHNQNGRPLLIPMIEHPMSQHAYEYINYPHHQPSKMYGPNYNTIDPQLRPSQNHSHPLQQTDTAVAYSLPPTQHASPNLSDSPKTRCASYLTTSMTPQGNQAENPFAYPAKFTPVNPAMNSSKLASIECSESCSCSKCCATFMENDDIQEDFCETEIGNPTPPYRQESLRTKQKPKPRHPPKRISKPPRRNLPSTASASKPPRLPPSQPSARTKTFNTKLAAVNGVVIPSTLPPGTLPVKLPSRASPDAHLSMRCPRCNGAFGKRDHVRSHFAACVGRNGNPEGVRWDDGVDGGR